MFNETTVESLRSQTSAEEVDLMQFIFGWEKKAMVADTAEQFFQLEGYFSWAFIQTYLRRLPAKQLRKR